MGKVVTRDEIIKIVQDGHKNGKTFVVTNGCFDILHAMSDILTKQNLWLIIQ